MMQVDFENVFYNVSQAIILRQLCDTKIFLANIVHFTRLFYGAHSSLYHQHGEHVESVTIIESFSRTR
jgi:hypothetical protein